MEGPFAGLTFYVAVCGKDHGAEKKRVVQLIRDMGGTSSSRYTEDAIVLAHSSTAEDRKKVN